MDGFFKDNPIKMDDLGYYHVNPYIYIYIYIYI